MRNNYRQYGWLCVWLLCRLYCSNAIVSLNCYTAFVSKCGRRTADVQVVTSKGFVTGVALAEEPTFHNVFRGLTVNRSERIRSDFINNQTSSLLALFISNLVLCVVAA